MMIIGYDAKRAFQNNTGLGNYSRMLVTSLCQGHKDVQAVLFAPRMSGEYKGYFTNNANISTIQPVGLGRRFASFWRSFRVSRLLKGEKVQIYHGLSHELPHGIPHSVRKVVTMHDLIVWRYPQYYSWFDRHMHRFKQKHSCQNADVVVAISQQTKRDLVEIMHLPEEKIRVLYQSCDQIFWQPVLEEDIVSARRLYHLPERYIVSVGTIEERKNQVSIVRAMSELPENIHLVLVGRPHTSYHGELLREIKERGLTNRVHIVSNASFEDFPAIYHDAICSVYVSRYEGWGIPILESMCCDTPVVTSERSSMPEVGGDAALYVDPEDPSAIAKQVKRIVTEHGLRQRLVEKGRVQREKFTQDKIADSFYNLYASLLE